jgi:3-phenylpropionate/trans-cinnamate dioxygenase ferredoxin reductase subunit
LALCTGSVVRELSIDRKLANVFYIRTSEDVTALKQQVDAGKRAVIIGAGYIGLEVASVLSGQGVEVTVLEMAERILQRVTSRTMSDYMSSLHTSQGVQIVTSTSVTAIEGQPAVEKVICDDGSEYFADIVIIGIGVLPHSELAIAAGLEVTDGVLVNEFCQTSDPDIYAAGDCTHHPSNTYDRLLRLESVQNANDQGRIAAANICGNQIPYDVVPWFWSDQYKVKLQMAGINSNYDKVICRGDSENTAGAGFALFYLKNGTLIAVDCVDRPKEFMVSKQLIKHRARLDPGQLLDESVEPIDFTS